MPFVTVTTNLGANQLPENFMNKFISHIAKVIERDPDYTNWTLLTNVPMSRGINNERLAYMEVRLEGFEVFDNETKTSKHIPKFFEFLVNNTCLSKEEIHIITYALPLWRIGRNGAAMKSVSQ